jgi:zinc transporter ZupT
VRALLLAAVVALGGLSAVFAVGALSNLADPHRDGAVSNYLMAGVPALLVAVASAYVVVRVSRLGREDRSCATRRR